MQEHEVGGFATALAWQPLVSGGRPGIRSERLRRLLLTAVLIVLLPLLCALLVLPFVYRNAQTAAPSVASVVESGIYSLPEPKDEARDSSLYAWLRVEDPRQCLLPDTRAGFSRLLSFQPRYMTQAFPVHQSAKPAAQPQYAEIFSLIAPQYPRTIANEEINRLWRGPAEISLPEIERSILPGAQRPIWRLADGTAIAEAEAPALSTEALEHWRSIATRNALSKLLRTTQSVRAVTTELELQALPPLPMPQLLEGPHEATAWPREALTRVALRHGCGDSQLDLAAVAALRQFAKEHLPQLSGQAPCTVLLQVDWNCW